MHETVPTVRMRPRAECKHGRAQLRRSERRWRRPPRHEANGGGVRVLAPLRIDGQRCAFLDNTIIGEPHTLRLDRSHGTGVASVFGCAILFIHNWARAPFGSVRVHVSGCIGSKGITQVCGT